MQLIEGSVPHLGQQLLQRFRYDFAKAKPSRKATQEGGRRTVGELTAAWHARAEDRRRRGGRGKGQACARPRPASRRPNERNISTRRPPGNRPPGSRSNGSLRRQAPRTMTRLLRCSLTCGTLRPAGSAERFSARLGELRLRHAKKPSLLKRLEKQGLG